MIFFPIQVINNFFDDPDKIVKFANQLTYKTDNEGNWPGKRSEMLHKIDNNFFNEIIGKLLILNFDYKFHNITWENVKMCFQKTYPYDSKNKLNILNKGIIHKDSAIDGDTPLVGLIYLTKNADLNSGTSIFNIKKNYKELNSKIVKQSVYKKDRDKLTDEDLKTWKNLITVNENDFEETIRINNVYNRLIMYNGDDYHRANNFYTGQKERLTLVFFVKQINSSAFFPIQRMKNYKQEQTRDNVISKRKSGKRKDR